MIKIFIFVKNNNQVQIGYLSDQIRYTELLRRTEGIWDRLEKNTLKKYPHLWGLLILFHYRTKNLTNTIWWDLERAGFFHLSGGADQAFLGFFMQQTSCPHRFWVLETMVTSALLYKGYFKGPPKKWQNNTPFLALYEDYKFLLKQNRSHHSF